MKTKKKKIFLGRNIHNFSCNFLRFCSNQTQKHKNQMYTKSNLTQNPTLENSKYQTQNTKPMDIYD